MILNVLFGYIYIEFENDFTVENFTKVFKVDIQKDYKITVNVIRY